MKPHTYTFTYNDMNGNPHIAFIEANGSTNAFNSAMMDTRFKGCKILKTTFRRADTAKGANRAGGLDSNGKQLNARNYRDTKATNWTNNQIQYPRLLAEIRAISLTPEQYGELCASMDLTIEDIDEILERAESDWETIKANT